VIEKTLLSVQFNKPDSLNEVIANDKNARKIANEVICAEF